MLKLTSIETCDFDTDYVTNMTEMFDGCKALTSLDLSKFDTSKVISMKGMFYDCSKLTTIYVAPASDWSSSEAPSDDMFKGCTKLVGGAGTVYDSEKIDKTYARVDGGTTSPGYFTVK